MAILAIIAFSCYLFCPPVSASYYPSGSIPCKLHSYTNADCSHRQLSQVPSLNNGSIKLLDVSHNKLFNLSNKAYFKHFNSLTVLNLSNSQITGFDNTTFQGLKSLLTLDLSNHKVTEIHGDPFKHLSSLLVLDLHRTFTRSSLLTLSYIAASAFTGLINLKCLDLHSNHVTSLPKDIFADLKNVRFLDLSHNDLKQVSTKFPASVQTLNISDNVYLSVEPDSIMNLTNLLEVKIVNTNTMNIKTFLHFLPKTPLQKLEMDLGSSKEVYESLVQFKQITTLQLEFYCYDSSPLYLSYLELLNSPLGYLSLSYLVHATFKPSTFQALTKWNSSMTHLEVLDSDTCYQPQFQGIDDLTFSLFTNLEKLTISKQFVSYLSEGAFDGLIKLQQLDLSHNFISFIPPHLFDVFTVNTLKYLDLNHNELIANLEFRVLKPVFTILSLEKLNIGRNPIKYGILCLENQCNFLQNLTEVNMEHSNLTPLITAGQEEFLFAIPSKSLLKLQLAQKRGESEKIYLDGAKYYSINPNLQYVDISNLLLQHSVSYYFGNTSNLTYLDISGSNLYDHTQSSVYYPLLKTLKLMRNRINTTQEINFLYAPTLTTLDLSNNLISNIHSEYIAMLSNLINLNLQDNRLKSLNWFNNLNKLRQIKIGQNFLSDIPKTFLTKIKYVYGLDASGNPYDCSHFTNCALGPFQVWILYDKFTFLTVGQYHCVSNSISITLVNLEYCKYLVPIYICTSFVGLVILGIVMHLLVKYHWHIRYRLFLLLHQRRYQRPLEEREDEDPGENAFEMRPLAPIYYRCYDCYIAYARQNEDWVNDELVPNIEDYRPEPFSLCIKERGDIPPGRFLLSSICHGIMHSRRTIVVLSEHFMADGMCDFQFHVAQNRLIKEGRDVLILVFLDDIPDAKKTLLLRQILCTNKTVLKWPQDPLGKDLFWRCLREELKRPVRIDRRFKA